MSKPIASAPALPKATGHRQAYVTQPYNGDLPTNIWRSCDAEYPWLLNPESTS